MPPAAIAGGVAAWGVGAGMTAATAAVVGAAVAGAVYGAVIGAATSMITGGNILKGALTGAAIGGVSAGVLQGVGAVDFVGATGAGVSTPSPGAEIAGIGGVSTHPAAETASAALRTAPQLGGTEGAKTVSELMTPTAKAVKGISDSKMNLFGGAIEGIGSGAGKVGAAMIKSEAAEDLAATTRRYEIDRINRNVGGDSPKKSVVSRWNDLTDMQAQIDKYKEPLEQDQNVGLLQPKVA